MIAHALRQAVEISSFARGADNFTELTGVPISESALQRLVVEYGSAIVEADEAEAKSMVQVPKEEEAVLWRQIPEPESETMAVSADGVMIHLRDEGWKEVKVMSVSAVPAPEQATESDDEHHLEHHSYRAGLWDAKTFTNHYWAESYRRGVEKAKRIVCISDGAAWIWSIVFICFARRIEILDWWHVVEYLWQTVRAADALSSSEAAQWIEEQKRSLARSEQRRLFARIRLIFPRGTSLPEPVLQAIGYLWHNRHRTDYATYRQAGLPIGSGTVESAAKTIVQQRMKQAGMRWSRPGAQAMLALRSRLFSQRWHELPV